MQFFRRLRPASNLSTRVSRLALQLDASLAAQLLQLANGEDTTPEVLAGALLREAVLRRLAAGRAVERWRSLSAREQEVCALVCLGLSNRQIAARLFLSAETIKTHVRSSLLKFGLGSREELVRTLEGWDFSAWEQARI